MTLTCCCIWLLFNWSYDGLQEVLRHTPVVYISRNIVVSSVMGPSPRLLSISIGILSIPSALLFFIFFMAALTSSVSTSGPTSSPLWSLLLFHYMIIALFSCFPPVEFIHIFFPLGFNIICFI